MAPVVVARLSRRPRSRGLAWGLGLAAGAILAAGAFLVTAWKPPVAPSEPRKQQKKPVGAAEVAHRPQESPPPDPPPRDDARPTDPPPESPPDQPRESRPQTALVDAADVPWASPTAGPPPTLVHLPPGSQIVLLARPADLLGRAEGRRFVRALGPRVEGALAAVAAACGCAVEEIDAIQAGWQTDPEAGPDAVTGGWAAWGRAALPVAEDESLRDRAWGATKRRAAGPETLFVGATRAYWLPNDGGGRVLVAAPEKLLEATVAAHASAADRAAAADWRGRLEAALPRDLEELVGMLDASRHLTLFGAPNYLLHDGRPLLAGPLARLVEPLGGLLRSESAAAAVSVHCADSFYAEVDAVAAAARSARKEAADLAGRLVALADDVEEYCNALDPHPYGRKLVMRLPRMLGILAANLRSGAEGKGIVVNCHLPEQAGHNLALAAELAIEQTPAATFAAAPAGGAPPQTAADRLAKRISLTFPRDTLEKSIQMLAEEIGVPIEILGKDLELEGITKNQSFGLDERDQPAEAILRTILARSNPDGKLVYVFRRRDGAESIDVTTRAAAAKRGDALPAAFAAGGPKGEDPR